MYAAPAEVIKPQPGPQTEFLASSADITVYGGSAGGGKTYGLLMEPLRHIDNGRFTCVMFRRTFPEIKAEGGLWLESQELYHYAGGFAREGDLRWEFESGATIRFSHLQHEQNLKNWMGSQIPLICFDELTHFTERQFFYLLSRNRSMCGVKPYVRATCNPDANSWVKKFLAPWVDKNYKGYGGRAKSGEVRWFIRRHDTIVWVPANTEDAKSVTFIRATIYDNKKLLKVNPEYLRNLKALPNVDRKRLLDGDWDIIESGNMFKREWFEVASEYPRAIKLVRRWDLASTDQEKLKRKKKSGDPDWTAGTLMGRTRQGIFYIIDVIHEQLSPGGVENLIKQTAALDQQKYGNVRIRIEEEPGSSGVTVTDHYRRIVLPSYNFKGVRSSGDKVERARPYSGHVEHGNVKLVIGSWDIEDFINEHCAFPSSDVHDDRVDASSGALFDLTQPDEVLNITGVDRIAGVQINKDPKSVHEIVASDYQIQPEERARWLEID